MLDELQEGDGGVIEGEVPSGWTLATVDDLGEFINGFAFKPVDWVDRGMPIIRIQNLTDPEKPLNRTEREVGVQYVVERGDILVSWSATLDVFNWSGPRAYVNQHIFKVVPQEALDKRFVFFALKEAIQELVNSEHLHGTTMKHINRRPFLAHPVPIPPLNEQRRIVEKIETLFAELDKGEESLREVQKLLARYRQSVLKAAVTGQLTADWRAENAHQLEHGRDLLERILQARRETWEGRGRYKEPVIPEKSDLPELPERWVWASLESLADHAPHSIVDGPFGSKLKTAHYTNNGVRVIRLENIGDGVFIDKKSFITESHAQELSRHSIKSGDIVIASLGQQLPKACVIPKSIETAIVKADCIRFSPFLVAANVKFVLAWLNSWILRNRVDEKIRGVGRPRLNLADIRSLPVPLPTRAEQDRIAALVSEAEERIEAVSVLCETELDRSAALRQCILKDAFAGRLVPQDPNDEPAAELLAHIKAARAAEPMKTRKKATA